GRERGRRCRCWRRCTRRGRGRCGRQRGRRRRRCRRCARRRRCRCCCCCWGKRGSCRRRCRRCPRRRWACRGCCCRCRRRPYADAFRLCTRHRGRAVVTTGCYEQAVTDRTASHERAHTVHVRRSSPRIACRIEEPAHTGGLRHLRTL